MRDTHTSPAEGASRPRTGGSPARTGAAPAFLLLALAPLVAEYLCGSMGMHQLSALPVLMALYGGGAVLIRETARRAGRGYTAIVPLALAYGLIEEGVLDQSLFNPHFNGLHLLDYGFVPALGLAVPWTLYVLTIHVIWSIVVPIALAEAISGRRTAPWLRLPGLLGFATLYLLGAWAVFSFSTGTSRFMASQAELTAALAGAAACIALAFAMPHRRSGVSVPIVRPWLAGALSFAATSALVLLYGQGNSTLHLPWHITAGGMAAMLLIMLLGGHACARTQTHRAAMAAGALLTYGWLGFFTEPVLHPGTPALPHAVLAAILAGIAALAIRNSRRTSPARRTSPV